MDLEDSIKNKYKAILAKYIEFKRQRSLYDFTDLPLYLYDVLKEYDEFIEVDGLFVDEFQDVDPVQLKVFNLVQSKNTFLLETLTKPYIYSEELLLKYLKNLATIQLCH